MSDPDDQPTRPYPHKLAVGKWPAKPSGWTHELDADLPDEVESVRGRVEIDKIREQSFDPKHPDLGWQTSIPEPLWVWSWRMFSLSTPSCCGKKFKTTDDYGSHYLRVHGAGEEAEPT